MKLRKRFLKTNTHTNSTHLCHNQQKRLSFILQNADWLKLNFLLSDCGYLVCPLPVGRRAGLIIKRGYVCWEGYPQAKDLRPEPGTLARLTAHGRVSDYVAYLFSCSMISVLRSSSPLFLKLIRMVSGLTPDIFRLLKDILVFRVSCFCSIGLLYSSHRSRCYLCYQNEPVSLYRLNFPWP